MGIEFWKKLLDYHVGYYADGALSRVVIFIPVAHLLRPVFTHMCAVVVSHAERATISACVCCARQINQYGGGARSMMIFKIHSRHTEKRTTGADDRDILSFPSQTTSGVANTLYGNGPLTVYLHTYCQSYPFETHVHTHTSPN